MKMSGVFVKGHDMGVGRLVFNYPRSRYQE